MQTITLGKRKISSSSRPYIIAEIGVNHECSMPEAIKMIEEAKEGGADAAKFQSYKAEKLASLNASAYWDTDKEQTLSQHALFRKYDKFNSQDYHTLAEHCKRVGIDFISTPFDNEAVDYLDPLVTFFKISSSDITNYPLLRKIASKNKPVILSTGASSITEIKGAVNELFKKGCSNIALLHCILNYPTEESNVNLNMITGLQKEFPELIVGYSDHSMPDESMFVLTSAYLKGARILEKHFTRNKKLPGNDHYHSMDLNDLQILKNNLNRLYNLEGSFSKNYLPSEEISRINARRSLVIKSDIEAGTVISEDILTFKRPASGISPKNLEKVIGRVVNKRLKFDHILTWGDLK
jgi:sialic acid synthase SpsE